MSLTINSNIAALTARRHLNSASDRLGKTFARLSSGLRVNSAADDAAGLSIATGMTAQIRGTNQAIRNANDAISLAQVAEGALAETENALQRMRELAVQASSDTYTTSDRSDLWEEVTELLSEIDRISSDTEFNDQNLLAGTNGSFEVKFHIGHDAGKTIDLAIKHAGTSAIGVIASNMGSAADITAMTTTSAQLRAGSVITAVDTALDSVSDIRATLGAVQNRLESAIASLSNLSENTEAARGRIMDADIASETSNLTRNAILQQAGTAVLAQANQQPQLALLLLN
ncbi:MAG: flagellin FliC [Magnetococcales bacterium]|nr:flagellin FliC [Magnetococcales bacterium]